MSSSKRLLVSDATHVGRVRTHNEDCHTAAKPFFAVADGIGGASYGEVASAEVIAASLEAVAKAGTNAEPEAATRSVFKNAHARMRRLHKSYPDMGTTLTTMFVAADLRSVVIGHTGDSRAYLFRDLTLRRLTEDENITSRGGRSYLVGAITTKEQTPPRFYMCEAKLGDLFVLCTDGVTNELDDERLRQILCTDGFPRVGASKVVNAAVAAGGRDNATAILVRFAQHNDKRQRAAL